MQQHSLRFAEAMRDASDGWLTLGQAFPPDSGSPAAWLAAMPYWREGRRMVGLTTVIEQDLLPTHEGQAVASLPLSPSGLCNRSQLGTMPTIITTPVTTGR